MDFAKRTVATPNTHSRKTFAASSLQQCRHTYFLARTASLQAVDRPVVSRCEPLHMNCNFQNFQSLRARAEAPLAAMLSFAKVLVQCGSAHVLIDPLRSCDTDSAFNVQLLQLHTQSELTTTLPNKTFVFDRKLSECKSSQVIAAETRKQKHDQQRDLSVETI